MKGCSCVEDRRVRSLRPTGCYIGGLVGPFGASTDIRIIIEASIETLDRARRNGVNSLNIESYIA